MRTGILANWRENYIAWTVTPKGRRYVAQSRAMLAWKNLFVGEADHVETDALQIPGPMSIRNSARLMLRAVEFDDQPIAP